MSTGFLHDFDAGKARELVESYSFTTDRVRDVILAGVFALSRIGRSWSHFEFDDPGRTQSVIDEVDGELYLMGFTGIKFENQGYAHVARAKWKLPRNRSRGFDYPDIDPASITPRKLLEVSKACNIRFMTKDHLFLLLLCDFYVLSLLGRREMLIDVKLLLTGEINKDPVIDGLDLVSALPAVLKRLSWLGFIIQPFGRSCLRIVLAPAIS
jgi:hypothetical protein